MRRRAGVGIWTRSAPLVAAVLLLAVFAGCASREQRVAEHLKRAAQEEQQGDLRAAQIDLKSALKLEPGNAEVNYRLAKLLQRRGDTSNALFYLRETQRLDPKRTDAPLDEAFLLMRADPNKAEALIDGVLKRDPSNALAYVRRSDLELAKSDTQKALEAALTAVQLAPDLVQTRFQLGLVQEARIREQQVQKKTPGDDLFKAAIEAFDQAAQAKDDQGEPGLYVRVALERARVLTVWPGHEKEAAQAFRQAYEVAKKRDQPLEPVIHATLGVARSASMREARIWALERQVELKPEDMRSWQELAIAQDPLTVDHSTVMDRLIQQRPDDAHAQTAWARDRAARGQADAAIAHLKEALGHATPKEALLAALVQLELSKGDVKAATAYRDELDKSYPDTPQQFYADGLVARRERKPGDAVAAFRKLVGVNETAASQRMLAEAELANGNAPAALDAVNRALQLSPHRGPEFRRLLHLRGRIQEAAGDHHGAIRTYSRLRRIERGRLRMEDLVPLARALYATNQDAAARGVLEPALAEPDAPRGAVLLYARREAERKPQEVKAVLDKALAKDPGDEAFVRVRADLDLREGNPQAAEQRLRAAIAADPKSADLRASLVRVLEVEGRKDDALAEARELMRAAPDDPLSSRVLARALIVAGKTEEARSALEKQHAEGSLDVGGRVLLARLDVLAGKDDEAIELLRSALHERDGLVGAKNDLAFLLAKHGRDLDEALSLAQDARKAAPNASPVADTLGFVYLKRGLPEAALPQLESAVELASPGSPEWGTAEYHRGLALEAMKRPAEAKAAFQKALAHEFPEAPEARTALQALESEKG